MERVARCLCGELSIRVKGDPKLSLACNCTNCQRRTGSAFGISALYENSSILEKSGNPKHFQAKSDSGNNIRTSFCPACGTSVYWELDFFPGLTGVAGGCFTDPDFPEPTAAVWNQSKYKWVEFPAHWHKMERQETKNA